MKKVFISTASFLGNKVGLTSEDVEVVAYGLEVAFSNILGLFMALGGGIILGIGAEVLTAAFVWLLIRRWAGGAHCSTLWRCALVSTTILLTAGGGALWLATVFNGWLLLVVLALGSSFTLKVILERVPMENPCRPKFSAERKKRMRCRAILMVGIISTLSLGAGVLANGVYASLSLAAVLALFTAGFTVTTAGYRLLKAVDLSLDFLGGKMLPGKGGEKQ